MNVLARWVLAVLIVATALAWLWLIGETVATVADLWRRAMGMDQNDDEQRARDVIAGAHAAGGADWDPHTDPKGNGTAAAARPNRVDEDALTPEERWVFEQSDAEARQRVDRHEDPDDPAVSGGTSAPRGDELQVLRRPPVELPTQPVAGRHEMTDTGEHHVIATAPGLPVLCDHCQGSGVVMRTVTDLLGESVSMISDGKAMVLEFYRRLLAAAPHLGELFPPDLLTAALNDERSRGAAQRDKLLEALLALADLYRPDDPDRMARLDTALTSMGTRHAAFQRGDGTVRGATLDEYAAVKAVFIATAHALVPDWRTEHDLAWSEAYDYAASAMLAAQFAARREGLMSARYPREAR